MLKYWVVTVNWNPDTVDYDSPVLVQGFTKPRKGCPLLKEYGDPGVNWLNPLRPLFELVNKGKEKEY